MRNIFILLISVITFACTGNTTGGEKTTKNNKVCGPGEEKTKDPDLEKARKTEVDPFVLKAITYIQMDQAFNAFHTEVARQNCHENQLKISKMIGKPHFDDKESSQVNWYAAIDNKCMALTLNCGVNPVTLTQTKTQNVFCEKYAVKAGQTAEVPPEFSNLKTEYNAFVKPEEVNIATQTLDERSLSAMPQTSPAASVQKDTTYDDLKHLASKSEGRKTLKFDKQVKIYKNNQLMLVQGTVYFFEDTGAVSSITGLQNTVTYFQAGQTINFRSWISFSKKGSVTFGFGSKDTVFKIGKYSVKYSPTNKSGYTAKIFFYESGNIASIHIREDQTLKVGNQNITFTHYPGCGADLGFYEDGTFKSGYVAQDTVFAGLKYKKGKEIVLSKRGNPILRGDHAKIDKPAKGTYKTSGANSYFYDVKNYSESIVATYNFYMLKFINPMDLKKDGKLFRVKGQVLFYPESETIMSITELLNAPVVEVGGKSIEIHKHAFFSKEGKLLSAKAVKDQTFKVGVNTVSYKAKAKYREASLSFYESGKLKSVQTADNHTLKVGSKTVTCGPKFSYYTMDLEFHENGVLKTCYAAADTRIGGKVFKAGEKIEFTNKGLVK
ncbi:hypothetical protein KKF34_16025 [Myxococcota bacterium]|nr:hypothetical protein [Myxococcota bacterium]MBU1380207.1 hypothetical protein [Myxococcota bacterium]MBU1498385.1 hypothetical protein [Myxococcota bacterium]